MSGKSKIEWTESTWNPVTGCSPMFAGCQYCYAARFAKRLQAMGNPRYKNAFEVTVHDDLISLPLSWKKPQMIFVNSMSDLFHEKVSDDVIKRIFTTMNSTPQHTYQILTKRAERLMQLSPELTWSNNIWMGVSIENEDVVFRADLLRETDAHIKFISAEPLLSSLDKLSLKGIDWLIVGGESGPGSRPMLEDWVLALKAKAEDTGTAFFFKQWGGTNKKKAGSLLQGKSYKAYPTEQ
mgnify:CR=1 FL=1